MNRLFVLSVSLLIGFVLGTSIFFCVASLSNWNRIATQKAEEEFINSFGNVAVNRIFENEGRISIGSTAESDYKSLSSGHVTKKDIENLSYITCKNYPIKSEDIRVFGHSSRLSMVCLDNNSLTDASWKEIADRMQNLESLNISNDQISAKGCQSLGTMKNLKSLVLTNVRISDDAFAQCRVLNLRYLILTNVPISEKGLLGMLPLDNLDVLMLINTKISEEITLFLNKCPNLSTIVICGAKIECKFLSELIHANKILGLSLSDSELNDDMFKNISRFSRLEQIDIVNCKITEKSEPLIRQLEQSGVLVVRNKTEHTETIPLTPQSP